MKAKKSMRVLILMLIVSLVFGTSFAFADEESERGSKAEPSSNSENGSKTEHSSKANHSSKAERGSKTEGDNKAKSAVDIEVDIEAKNGEVTVNSAVYTVGAEGILNAKEYKIDNNEIDFEIINGTGKYKEYYENEQLKIEGDCINGELNGNAKQYTMKGILFYDGGFYKKLSSYRKGKRQGY